jgi:cation diffusion facilitator CzcD-associated flavoprotein CzcO
LSIWAGKYCTKLPSAETVVKMAPIKTVGVIGAGVSGVAAAAHLKSAGLKVTVFERSSVAGGVW